MSPIREVIINKQTAINPIWIMRQAGRYLPEFREIRKQNPDFIKLCLNETLSSEITLQPLKRFDLDAAIIFSDILMVPYGLNQKVEFKKNFGPLLGDLNLENIVTMNETDFVEKIHPVYKAINLVSKSQTTKNKSTIGFVGAPWTLLVYMINQKSPKFKLKQDFFKDTLLINKILVILEKFLGCDLNPNSSRYISRVVGDVNTFYDFDKAEYTSYSDIKKPFLKDFKAADDLLNLNETIYSAGHALTGARKNMIRQKVSNLISSGGRDTLLSLASDDFIIEGGLGISDPALFSI